MRGPEYLRSLGNGKKLAESNTAGNPLEGLDNLGDLVRSHAFSGFSKEILQEWFDQGRDALDDQRRALFAVKVLIDRAPKEEKLAIYKKANYPKILQGIAEASSLIGIKKAVEGETITKEEQEARIRAKWIKLGMDLGMTEKRAARAIDNSVRFTKRAQARVEASENPPVGGLRAVYEKESK